MFQLREATRRPEHYRLIVERTGAIPPAWRAATEGRRSSGRRAWGVELQTTAFGDTMLL